MTPQEFVRACLHESDALKWRAWRTAGTLDPVQLHWRPSPGRWSIAEHLEHLAAFNRDWAEALARTVEGAGGEVREPVPGEDAAGGRQEQDRAGAPVERFISAQSRIDEAVERLAAAAGPLPTRRAGACLVAVLRHARWHLDRIARLREAPEFPG